MHKYFRSFFVFIILLSSFFAVSKARAYDLGILPPDIDYASRCIKDERLSVDPYNWSGKTIAQMNLSTEKLIELLELYYNGSVNINPNYPRVLNIINYLVNKKAYQINKALLTKAEMLIKGKGIPQDISKGKELLDSLIKSGEIKAHKIYGVLLTEEGEYIKAAEHYKKAIIAGELSAMLKLSYLYHEKKLPVSDKEIEIMIINAQNVALNYIAQGKCSALTIMGIMYNQLNNVPNAKYYSVKWFEKVALLDDITAKLYLANFIIQGIAKENDKKRVVQLWTEAADLGSQRAMFLLGEYHSFSGKKDEMGKAIKWLEKASLRNSKAAAVLLSRIYEGWEGIKADKNKRLYWLEKASEHPNVESDTLMELAELYEQDDNVPPEKLFSLYQRASLKGSGEALVKLGDAYRYGIGTDRAPTKALRYYRLAASNGKKAAMKAMKQAYECSIGKEYDDKKIEFWADQINYYSEEPFLKAAYDKLLVYPYDDSGELKASLERLIAIKQIPEAMILLGVYYQKTGNNKLSNYWFNKTIETDKKENSKYNGHAFFGNLYIEGELVKKDIKRGQELLNIAAQMGHPGAHNKLGKFFMRQGEFSKAEEHLFKAAKNGKVSAYMDIAEIKIQQHKENEAIHILEIAGKRNVVEAMLRLAGGYSSDGWIQEKNEQKAKKWFTKAVESYPCMPGEILKVADSYMEGKNGAPQDVNNAEKWFIILAGKKAETDEDKMRIAFAILNSSLAEKPDKRNHAISVIEKFADNKNSTAISWLTNFYFNKAKTREDSSKAIYWLNKSAENGHIPSMIELANLYISGYMVEESKDKSIYWLKKASASGSQKAKERLQKFK